MPRDGYTRMFERMLDHPNITVQTRHGLRATCRTPVPFRRLIWTGPVDEFFGHRYGKLPYRCLRFRHETLRQRAVPAGRHGELPADRGLHPHHRIQAPDRPGAPLHQRHLRVSDRRRRPVLPRAAAGEPGAVQALRGAGGRRRPTRGSSAGSRPIATSTWTRWSARRWPPSAASRSECPRPYAEPEWGVAAGLPAAAGPALASPPAIRPRAARTMGRDRVQRRAHRRHLARPGARDRASRSRRARSRADRGARHPNAAVSGAVGTRARRPGRRSGWAWHDRQLDALRRRGIAPIAGLVHHGAGPRGHRAARSALPAAARRPCRTQAAARYPDVAAWTPVNEPLTTARFACLYGHWYPHGATRAPSCARWSTSAGPSCSSMRAIRATLPRRASGADRGSRPGVLHAPARARRRDMRTAGVGSASTCSAAGSTATIPGARMLESWRRPPRSWMNWRPARPRRT